VYAYTVAGNYTVTVNVTDELANLASCNFSISVNEPLNVTDCMAAPSPVKVGQNTTFSANASGGVGTYTWDWDFGDGNSSALESPTHAYSVSGNKTACVNVTDALNNEEQCCVDVTFVCLPGDANLDGVVDTGDVIVAKRMILTLDPPNTCADVNEDGDIDVGDVIKTKRIILGLD